MRNSIANSSLLFETDSYKLSQFIQDSDGLTYMSSYVEPRKSWKLKTDTIDEVVLFGLQAFLKEYPLTITQTELDFASPIFKQHGTSFNYKGFQSIIDKLDGNIPIQIDSLPEGTIVKVGTPLVRVTSTNKKYSWVVRFMETAILRAIWYPTTVASLSYKIKLRFKEYWKKSSTSPIDTLDYKLHDFGFRGCSSVETGILGGMAHLLTFKGGDTLGALIGAQHYYNTNLVVGFSIDASEHSTVTITGPEGEEQFLIDHITNSGKGNNIIASVVDSYDFYHIVDTVIGKNLKDFIKNSGKTLVVRPDSGDPKEIVMYCLNSLWNSFGGTINEKGFKVLHPSVRVIQGDGVNFDSIMDIMNEIMKQKFSIDNIAFGMGGKLLQGVSRDDFGFAYKVSYAIVNNKGVAVYKDPITDPGKKSKKGIVYVDESLKYTNIKPKKDMLQPIWKDGTLIKQLTFEEVRNNTQNS